MNTQVCLVTNHLASHLAEQDRRAARADAIESLAAELLADPQFIWDWLGDIDQGDGLRGQAIAGIVRAVMAEMKTNPALAHRYKRLALKEAQCQLKKEIEQCSRAF
jgi:hypothetical protein